MFNEPVTTICVRWMQSSVIEIFPSAGMLQVEQAGRFWAVVYWPNSQFEHARSVVVEPAAATYLPAVHVVHKLHKSSLVLAEYAPVLQGVHTRSVILVPFEEMYFPTVQEVQNRHSFDGGRLSCHGGARLDNRATYTTHRALRLYVPCMIL